MRDYAVRRRPRSFFATLLAAFARLIRRRRSDAVLGIDPLGPEPPPIPPWPDPPRR